MEDDHFFELADRFGMLIMPGWCCCDAWQHWESWGPEQVFFSHNFYLMYI
jgi:exo-1,4-beta-D-glucosaminidase